MSAETYVETWRWGSLGGRFATIDYVDAIGGYEWDEFHVMRGANGDLYVGADGGCSCNSFADADPATFTRVASWQEAAEKAQEWATSEDWNKERRRSVVMDLIERLAQKRPAAFVEVDPRTFGSLR